MNKFKSAVVLVGLGFFGLVANSAILNSETEAVSKKLGAASFAEVQFEKGQSTLSAEDLNLVHKTIQEAKVRGKIAEVKIVSWADQEYPASGEKAPKASVRLAKSRAEHLKDYVVKEFNVDFVETYNMAKRPNAIQEIFKTTTAKVKTTLEKGGAAPSSPEDTGILGLNGKTASALVLIYVK